MSREYAAALRAADTGWRAEGSRARASRYVSPPEIAPHGAGAAVALTFVDAYGTGLSWTWTRPAATSGR